MQSELLTTLESSACAKDDLRAHLGRTRAAQHKNVVVLQLFAASVVTSVSAPTRSTLPSSASHRMAVMP